MGDTFPITEKTIWSVLYVLATKRFKSSRVYFISEALLPSMLCPKGEPLNTRSSKSSKMRSEGESL